MTQERPHEPESVEIATEMFLAKWGFGEPPPAYRAAWEADMKTLAFLASIEGRPK